MRRIIALALVAALPAAGCAPLDQEAMVLALDPSEAVEVVANDRDGFASPDGLIWADGVLYVADEGGSALRAWRPGGAPHTLADGRAGLMSPEDLARDREGNIYFSDDSRGGVWRIGRDGRTTAIVPAKALPSTEALALSPAGDIIVGDGPGHRILKVTRDGAMSVLVGPERRIAKPESLAFDGGGNLYIADNEDDVLYMLTPDGKLHRTIADRSGFSPESLHFAGDALYITDSRHGKLFRYTPEDGLAVVALFGGSLANIQGVTSDGAGNIFVSVQSDLKGRKGYILRLYRKERTAEGPNPVRSRS